MQKNRIKHILKETCISEKQLLAQYKLCIKTILPDFTEMKTLMYPPFSKYTAFVTVIIFHI